MTEFSCPDDLRAEAFNLTEAQDVHVEEKVLPNLAVREGDKGIVVRPVLYYGDVLDGCAEPVIEITEVDVGCMAGTRLVIAPDTAVALVRELVRVLKATKAREFEMSLAEELHGIR